jgi:hypothetical protein
MDGTGISAIATVVDKIRDHRFDGYSTEGIALEIDAFRSGAGTGSIGDAVDALQAVATALLRTEDTLRTELGKLGVDWQGAAADRAGAVFIGQANYTRVAKDKVDDAAELIFAQGEAFTRTLHKLPDAATLRAGKEGLSLGDGLLSLIGFETDNARAVQESREARQQAVEALNAYARESGDNLAKAQEISRPQALRAATGADGVPDAVDAGGAPPPVTQPVPDPGTTAAAGANAGGVSAPISRAAVPAPAPVFDPPTPAMGIAIPDAARSGGSAPGGSVSGSGAPVGSAPGTTAPSGITAPPASSPTGNPNPVPGAPPVRSGQQAPAPGGSFGTAPGGGAVPGPGSGSGPAGGGQAGGAVVAPNTGSGNNIGSTPGTRGGAPAGRFAAPLSGSATPVTPGYGSGEVAAGRPPAAGNPAGGDALGRGRLVGSAAPPPVHGTPAGGAFTTVPRPPAGGADLAAGAAAFGAGGAAGATGGEQERRGRGVGRSAPLAGKTGRGLPIGDLPEEEATALRNSEKVDARQQRPRDAFLERAGGQDSEGDPDGEHVRRYGVDDKDLFTDQRMVAPELLGDDPRQQR